MLKQAVGVGLFSGDSVDTVVNITDGYKSADECKTRLRASVATVPVRSHDFAFPPDYWNGRSSSLLL
jgi:hypothetical protein